MSKRDYALKDAIEFFIKEPSGQIEIDKYSWGSDDERWALNNLTRKGLLKRNNSKLIKKYLEYKPTQKFINLVDILKPMSRTQRIKYVKEWYRNETYIESIKKERLINYDVFRN